MGSLCGRHFPNPDTTNVCTNDPIGHGDTRDYQIPHFCTTLDIGGKGRRKEYCEKIGDDEWTIQGDGIVEIGCTYDLCGQVKNFAQGCCHSCCGAPDPGAGAKCERKAYRGDNTTCCFRDLAYNTSTKFCFETDDKQKTCDPNYRDITNCQCQDEVLSYCTGADLDPNDTSWINRWSTDLNLSNNCIYALNRNLFTDPNVANVLSGIQPPASDFDNAQGFAWSRTLMQDVFTKYSSQGFRIGTVPGFPGYNDFQDNILQPICTTVPGICQEALTATCSNTTTNDLLRNPALVPWCGCYMPDDQYQTYVDQFQVNQECTPICARQGNIPLVTTSGIEPLLCNQRVCIIDDVTIALENTNVGGSINFSQFCGACSAPVSGVNGANFIDQHNLQREASSCTCIIADDTIAAASSQIRGDIDLNNSCGKNSKCFKQNPNPASNNLPSQLEIPCDAPANFDPFAAAEQRQEEESAQRGFRSFVTFAIIVIAIILIIIVILYLSGLGNDTTTKVIPKLHPAAKTLPDPQVLAQQERLRLFGDQATNVSLYDRDMMTNLAGFPEFPQPSKPSDLTGSLFDRTGLTPVTQPVSPASATKHWLGQDTGLTLLNQPVSPASATAHSLGQYFS